MAGYRIVLNLTGNAVNKAERLASALERANLAAKSLTTTLPIVGRSLNNVNTRNLRLPRQQPARSVAQPQQTTRRGSLLQPRQQNQPIGSFRSRTRQTAILPARPVRATPSISAPRQPNYTRHRSTRIFSFGQGFNFGGFTGRLSTILQPDAMGKIAGMNASSLFKAFNAVGIAMTLAKKIGKAIILTVGTATLAPIAVGGMAIRTAINALQSESFAEGVKLISRRHQARRGLGEDYLQAEQNADFLAGTYGLDRSTAISSINVLTGLGVGGSERELNLSEATMLTKTGGLIAQHNGVPFERVMTNIQQLLVNQTPNMRDIRELLNQAPILGKYALREIKDKGLENSTNVRDYLKDQKNILSVLKAYELDNASNAGMQARGQIQMAQQDAWAKIADNDPFWQMTGNYGSEIIGSMADAANRFMIMLEQNDSFRIMVRNIEYMFENFGDKGNKFLDNLLNGLQWLFDKFGIDLGDVEAARLEADKDKTLTTTLRSVPEVREAALRGAEKAGYFKDVTPTNRKAAEERFITEFVNNTYKNDTLRQQIVPVGRLYTTSDEYVNGRSNTESNRYRANKETIVSTTAELQRDTTTYRFFPVTERNVQYNKIDNGVRAWENKPTGNWLVDMFTDKNARISDPKHAAVAYDVPLKTIESAAEQFVEGANKIGTLKLDDFKGTGGGAGAGSDITGINRDRRALTINFNNKLVEWNSTITTDSPEETVEVVSQNLEEITGMAIQKALLGATNKMTTSWY